MKNYERTTKVFAKTGLDGSTIGGKSLINFGSGRHSNNQHQLLSSAK